MNVRPIQSLTRLELGLEDVETQLPRVLPGQEILLGQMGKVGHVLLGICLEQGKWKGLTFITPVKTKVNPQI